MFISFQDDNIQGNIYDDDDDEELFVDDKDKAKVEEVSKTDDKKDNQNENDVEDTTTENTKDNNDDISKLLEETKVPELPDINSVKKSVKFPEIVAKVRISFCLCTIWRIFVQLQTKSRSETISRIFNTFTQFRIFNFARQLDQN